MEFTCTVRDSVLGEEDVWAKDFVEITVEIPDSGPYCELVMETNAQYRIENQSKKEDA
jgi:hypothetical protein